MSDSVSALGDYRRDNAISAALAKSESVYDNCNHDIWQAAVYERIHAGREFANISGLAGLDYFASSVLVDNAIVLDFGCGAGDGCIYLANSHDLHAVGVDINTHQIARAIEKSKTSVAKGNIRYYAKDLAECDFGRYFDGICTLDSLSLMAEPLIQIMNVSSALKAGAPFFVADIFAGANIDAAAKRFALNEDGMISLCTEQEFTDKLSQAGFTEITWTDQTELAVDVFQSILAGVEAFQESSAHMPTSLVEEWLESSRFYVQAFKDRRFHYSWCLAYKGP